jgi:predicted transcriptional regulator
MMMMEPRLTLDDDSAAVLRALRERAMDGYTLLSKTSLDPEKLNKALQELQSAGIVMVKGELSANNVGDAYLYVPTDQKGYVDMLIGNFRFSSRAV